VSSTVGTTDGATDGIALGSRLDGCRLGLLVSSRLGNTDGLSDGVIEGEQLGVTLGSAVGGKGEGESVTTDGAREGKRLPKGIADGERLDAVSTLGENVGRLRGLMVGETLEVPGGPESVGAGDVVGCALGLIVGTSAIVGTKEEVSLRWVPRVVGNGEKVATARGFFVGT
jgi:hypothetical protein